MNAKWKSILLQIFTLLLGGFAVGNFSQIQSGAVMASPGNYGSWVAIPGGASLLALVWSLYRTYKGGGGINIARTAEVAALVTLSTALYLDGDTEGLNLLATFSEHLKKRTEATPVEPAKMVQNAQAQLIKAVEAMQEIKPS